MRQPRTRKPKRKFEQKRERQALRRIGETIIRSANARLQETDESQQADALMRPLVPPEAHKTLSYHEMMEKKRKGELFAETEPVDDDPPLHRYNGDDEDVCVERFDGTLVWELVPAASSKRQPKPKVPEGVTEADLTNVTHPAMYEPKGTFRREPVAS